MNACAPFLTLLDQMGIDTSRATGVLIRLEAGKPVSITVDRVVGSVTDGKVDIDRAQYEVKRVR